MKKKETLILEYAKLAAQTYTQGQHTVSARMKEIENKLQLTGQAIMQKATTKAIATFK